MQPKYGLASIKFVFALCQYSWVDLKAWLRVWVVQEVVSRTHTRAFSISWSHRTVDVGGSSRKTYPRRGGFSVAVFSTRRRCASLLPPCSELKSFKILPKVVASHLLPFRRLHIYSVCLSTSLPRTHHHQQQHYWRPFTPRDQSAWTKNRLNRNQWKQIDRQAYCTCWIKFWLSKARLSCFYVCKRRKISNAIFIWR